IAVGKEIDFAVGIEDLGDSHPHLDHTPGDRSDSNSVSDHKLVVNHNKKAGDDILDQLLCAKPDGQADHPGGGDKRHDIETKCFQQQYAEDKEQHIAYHAFT